jgi:hypothetical protein
MKTIWYRVVVTEDKEQDFLRAMEGLSLIYYKDFEEIIEKIEREQKQNDIIIA